MFQHLSEIDKKKLQPIWLLKINHKLNEDWTKWYKGEQDQIAIFLGIFGILFGAFFAMCIVTPIHLIYNLIILPIVSLITGKDMSIYKKREDDQ